MKQASWDKQDNRNRLISGGCDALMAGLLHPSHAAALGGLVQRNIAGSTRIEINESDTKVGCRDRGFNHPITLSFIGEHSCASVGFAHSLCIPPQHCTAIMHHGQFCGVWFSLLRATTHARREQALLAGMRNACRQSCGSGRDTNFSDTYRRTWLGEVA
jgi:hypothetical protein